MSFFSNITSDAHEIPYIMNIL